MVRIILVFETNFSFLDDFYTKSEYVSEEEVFKNFLDGITRYSKVVEDNIEDFYSIFKTFLNQEYYKTFENEVTSLNVQEVQAQIENLKDSKKDFANLYIKLS